MSKSRRGLDVIAVVTPENVARLGASMRFLVGLGAQRVTLNPAFDRAFDETAFVAWESGLAEVAALWKEARATGRRLELPTFDRKVLAAARGGLSATDAAVSAREASPSRLRAISIRANGWWETIAIRDS